MVVIVQVYFPTVFQFFSLIASFRCQRWNTRKFTISSIFRKLLNLNSDLFPHPFRVQKFKSSTMSELQAPPAKRKRNPRTKANHHQFNRCPTGSTMAASSYTPRIRKSRPSVFALTTFEHLQWYVWPATTCNRSWSYFWGMSSCIPLRQSDRLRACSISHLRWGIVAISSS